MFDKISITGMLVQKSDENIVDEKLQEEGYTVTSKNPVKAFIQYFVAQFKEEES